MAGIGASEAGLRVETRRFTVALILNEYLGRLSKLKCTNLTVPRGNPVTRSPFQREILFLVSRATFLRGRLTFALIKIIACQNYFHFPSSSGYRKIDNRLCQYIALLRCCRLKSCQERFKERSIVSQLL